MYIICVSVKLYFFYYQTAAISVPPIWLVASPCVSYLRYGLLRLRLWHRLRYRRTWWTIPFSRRVGFTIWRLARRRCKGRRDAGFLMRYCAIIIWTFPSYLYRSGSDGFIATVLKTKHPKLDRNVILPESGALLVSGWKLL